LIDIHQLIYILGKKKKKILIQLLMMNFLIVMAREIFGPEYLPYRQKKQMRFQIRESN